MEAGLHETFGEDLHRGQIRGHHADHGAHGGGEDVQSERLIRLVAVDTVCCAAAPEPRSAVLRRQRSVPSGVRTSPCA